MMLLVGWVTKSELFSVDFFLFDLQRRLGKLVFPMCACLFFMRVDKICIRVTLFFEMRQRLL